MAQPRGDGMKMIKDILILGIFTGKESRFSDRLRVACGGMQGAELLFVLTLRFLFRWEV